METLCRLSYRGRAELGVRVGTDRTIPASSAAMSASWSTARADATAASRACPSRPCHDTAPAGEVRWLRAVP